MFLFFNFLAAVVVVHMCMHVVIFLTNYIYYRLIFVVAVRSTLPDRAQSVTFHSSSRRYDVHLSYTTHSNLHSIVQAVRTCLSGRPGVCYVDLPGDMITAQTETADLRFIILIQ